MSAERTLLDVLRDEVVQTADDEWARLLDEVIDLIDAQAAIIDDLTAERDRLKNARDGEVLG